MKSQTHQFWIIFGIVVFGLVFLLVTGSRNPQSQPQASGQVCFLGDNSCQSGEICEIDQGLQSGVTRGRCVSVGSPSVLGPSTGNQSNSFNNNYNPMMPNTTFGNNTFRASPYTQTAATQQLTAFTSQNDIWSPCRTIPNNTPNSVTPPRCEPSGPVRVQRQISSPNSASGSRIEICLATCRLSSRDPGGVSVGWPEICQPVIDDSTCVSIDYPINNFTGNLGGFSNNFVPTFSNQPSKNQIPSNWPINVNDDIIPSSNDSIYSFLNQAETLTTGGVTMDSLLSGITSGIISGLQSMQRFFPSAQIR